MQKDTLCYKHYKDIVYRYSIFRNEVNSLTEEANSMFLKDNSLDYDLKYDEFGNNYYTFYCTDGTSFDIFEIEGYFRFGNIVNYWDDEIEDYDYKLDVNEYEKVNNLKRDYELITINNNYYFYEKFIESSDIDNDIYKKIVATLVNIKDSKDVIKAELIIDVENRLSNNPRILTGSVKEINNRELSMLKADMLYVVCNNIPKDKYELFCDFISNDNKDEAALKVLSSVVKELGNNLELEKEMIFYVIDNSQVFKTCKLYACNNYYDFYILTDYIISEIESYIYSLLDNNYEFILRNAVYLEDTIFRLGNIKNISYIDNYQFKMGISLFNEEYEKISCEVTVSQLGKSLYSIELVSDDVVGLLNYHQTSQTQRLDILFDKECNLEYLKLVILNLIRENTMYDFKKMKDYLKLSNAEYGKKDEIIKGIISDRVYNVLDSQKVDIKNLNDTFDRLAKYRHSLISSYSYKTFTYVDCELVNEIRTIISDRKNLK